MAQVIQVLDIGKLFQMDSCVSLKPSPHLQLFQGDRTVLMHAYLGIPSEELSPNSSLTILKYCITNFRKLVKYPIFYASVTT